MRRVRPLLTTWNAMSTTELFRRFHAGLVPTSAHEDVALERLVECAMALTRVYHPSTKAVEHITEIGSIAKGTAIAPLSDIDFVFHLPVGTWKRFDDYQGNGQSALLQEVRGILLKRNPRTGIRGDGPVVVVEFTTGPNVEVVPAVLVSSDADLLHVSCSVPVTKGGGAWEKADYGAEYDRVQRAQSDSDNQYGRLIRYIKAWRRHSGATLSSVLLEQMALDFMANWPANRHAYVYDDWLVRDFLAYAVANHITVYALPSGKRLKWESGWYVKAGEALTAARSACLLPDTGSLYIHYWRKVFGSGFGA